MNELKKTVFNVVITAVIAGVVAGVAAVVTVGLVGQNNQPASLGGKTRLPEVNVSWIELGDKVSSSSAPVYKFSAYYVIDGAEASDFFTNTQLDASGNPINLMVTNLTVHVGQNATSTTRLRVATTTKSGVYDIANKDTEEIAECAIVKQLIATSTGVNWLANATSTTPTSKCDNRSGGGSFLLKYGESVGTFLIPGSSGENDVDVCRGDAGFSHCEAATSTALGIKPVTTVIEGYSTTTPAIPYEDTR